jgi:hypothetical protein
MREAGGELRDVGYRRDIASSFVRKAGDTRCTVNSTGHRAAAAAELLDAVDEPCSTSRSSAASQLDAAAPDDASSIG